MILFEVPTVGARSPMEKTATEGCMRQRTKTTAGLEAAPVSRKKDHAVHKKKHACLVKLK